MFLYLCDLSHKGNSSEITRLFFDITLTFDSLGIQDPDST